MVNDGKSSPRMWGCFQQRLRIEHEVQVFPTHVGVFPDRRVLFTARWYREKESSRTDASRRRFLTYLTLFPGWLSYPARRAASALTPAAL